MRYRLLSLYSSSLLMFALACDTTPAVDLTADASADNSLDGRVVDTLPDAAPCTGTETTTLPGAHIVMDPQPCRFTLAQAAAGITFNYRVIVNHDIPGVVPVPQDIGGCGTPGSSGLTVFERIQGGDQHYCRCDVGYCGYRSLPPPATLRAGEYQGSLTWTGRAWNGPSDVASFSSMGAPFSPGTYTVRVSAKGNLAGDLGSSPSEVAAELPIVLFP